MRQHLSMQFEKLNGRMEQMERNLKRRNSAFSTGTNAPGLSNSGRKLQAEGDLATFRAKGRRVQNGQECMENEVAFAMKEGILNVYVKLVT